MKPITVNDKRQIKQLLYGGNVLGVRDDSCQAFGGFELWWYDRQHDICRYCRSSWASLRRRIEAYSLDRAASRLWQRRNELFVRHKQLSQDAKLLRMTHLCN